MSVDGSQNHRCLIRLKGVPPKATVEDVLTFFDGLDIDESCIRLNFKERRGAGEAFIVFKTAEDARRACEKDRDFFSPNFGSRFVRVMAVEDLSQEELTHVDTAFTSQSGKRPATSILSEGSPEITAVRVEGLPANITIPEVVQLFWGISASPAGTVVQKDPTKPHAHAYMKFGTPEHAMRAVITWNGTVMTTQAGMFTLSVQPASHDEWDVAAAAGSSKTALRDDAVIKVRGLPVRATCSDVATFFEGYKTKPGGVHIQPFSENRHSKIAYVEFETCEEANRALEKDRHLFGKAFGERYCLLQRVSKQEMTSDLARFTAQQGRGPAQCGSASSSLEFTTSCCPPGAFFNMPRSANMPPGVPYMMPGAFPQPGPQGHHQMLPQMPQGMPWPTPGMPQMPGFPSLGMQMPHMPPQMPFPGLMQAMHAFPGSTWPPGAGVQGPGPPQHAQQPSPVTGAARYMVQDLTTGQKVYLDPRFNIFPHAPPQSPVVPVAVRPAQHAGPAPNAMVTPAAAPGPGPEISHGHDEAPALGAWAAAGRSVAVAPAGHDGSGGSGASKGSEPTQETAEQQEEGSNEGSDGDRSSRPPPAKKGAHGGIHHHHHNNLMNSPAAANGLDGYNSNNGHSHNGSGNGNGVTSLLRDPKDAHKRPFVDANLAEDQRPVKFAAAGPQE